MTAVEFDQKINAIDILEAELPDGPDKTFIIRQHRQTAMWANVSITRQADGAPRE